LNIGNSVDEDQGKGEYFPEDVECFAERGVKIPSVVLLGQLN